MVTGLFIGMRQSISGRQVAEEEFESARVWLWMGLGAVLLICWDAAKAKGVPPVRLRFLVISCYANLRLLFL